MTTKLSKSYFYVPEGRAISEGIPDDEYGFVLAPPKCDPALSQDDIILYFANTYDAKARIKDTFDEADLAPVELYFLDDDFVSYLGNEIRNVWGVSVQGNGSFEVIGGLPVSRLKEVVDSFIEAFSFSRLELLHYSENHEFTHLYDTSTSVDRLKKALDTGFVFSSGAIEEMPPEIAAQYKLEDAMPA